MTDTYETDIVVWSEEQAALLRRLAAGERVYGQPPLPLPNECPWNLEELLPLD